MNSPIVILSKLVSRKRETNAPKDLQFGKYSSNDDESQQPTAKS